MGEFAKRMRTFHKLISSLAVVDDDVTLSVSPCMFHVSTGNFPFQDRFTHHRRCCSPAVDRAKSWACGARHCDHPSRSSFFPLSGLSLARGSTATLISESLFHLVHPSFSIAIRYHGLVPYPFAGTSERPRYRTAAIIAYVIVNRKLLIRVACVN